MFTLPVITVIILVHQKQTKKCPLMTVSLNLRYVCRNLFFYLVINLITKN